MYYRHHVNWDGISKKPENIQEGIIGSTLGAISGGVFGSPLGPIGSGVYGTLGAKWGSSVEDYASTLWTSDLNTISKHYWKANEQLDNLSDAIRETKHRELLQPEIDKIQDLSSSLFGCYMSIERKLKDKEKKKK